MPNTTTRASLRSPLGSEAADGPTGMQHLAQDVDAKLLIWLTGTTAAKPASATNGRLYYETDGDRLSYDQGATWRKILMQLASGDYKADTPVDATALKIAGTLLASTHLSDTAALARLAGPTFTGTPSAPTPAAADNSTKIATTAYADRAVANGMPTGAIIMHGAAAAPPGWVLCDGASYLRADGTHDALFASIGVLYGSADGTHFNVPDFCGRVPVGYAATGGHADVSTLGNNDGVAKANRRAKHNHTVSTVGAVNTNPGDNGATGGHTDAAGNTNNAAGLEFPHTHVVGPGGTASVDAPANLVVNFIIKL